MSAQATGPETLGSLSDEPEITDPNSAQAKEISGKSPFQIAMARLRRDKIALVCAAVVLFFILVAIFADLIAKAFGVSLDTVTACDVLECNFAEPGVGYPKTGPPFHSFDPEHPFGLAPRTGADNLAHWVYGCRTSLLIAGAATLFSSVVGIVVGLVSGFAGGVVDKILSFITDFFLTIPFLLAALTIAPIIIDRFGTSDSYETIQIGSLILILSMFGWMTVARLIRGEVLSLREREFIHAARVLGMPTWRILFKELLPNLTAPIVISISLMLPAFVAAEAGLAFLGIGVTGSASWGQTIANAVPYWSNYAAFLWQPLIGVVALVLSLNLLGDAVRDAFDPKTRR
ncbi:ABC transporter permease [Nocardioides sp. STR2]|jgi:peptide/nickel transport system permease protein|uniref:ABC transporter permease n=1 Tax=Nocardioides pini TaxID=2975053 RepID=A0ABT4CEJ1_9ACTN|nr:ABC transporter permease [Nocardioides pini]MCY4727369.1 ABC transporter permease [Nocardioides pini]